MEYFLSSGIYVCICNAHLVHARANKYSILSCLFIETYRQKEWNIAKYQEDSSSFMVNTCQSILLFIRIHCLFHISNAWNCCALNEKTAIIRPINIKWTHGPLIAIILLASITHKPNNELKNNTQSEVREIIVFIKYTYNYWNEKLTSDFLGKNEIILRVHQNLDSFVRNSKIVFSTIDDSQIKL